eukprot:m.217014 g.217014  ORF g.217014 m.217014 type:complete len:1119 (-) comp33224_c0_seq1:61-3417(-)
MSSKWLYDDMPDVPGLFGDDLVDGTFLVYKRTAQQKGDFVLNVVFKGKITKHLITVVDGGLQVGKNTFDCKNIEVLVEKLSQPNVAGWPVQLTAAPSNSAVTSVDTAVSASDLAVDESMPWLHKDIPRERAAELVMEVGKDGTFLVRSRDGTGDYAMCVVYKGKPTHHMVTPNDDGVMMVNKKTFGNTGGLAQLIAILQRPATPGWPVALSHGVKAEETKTETEAEKPPPRPVTDKPPPRPAAAKPSTTEESIVERLPSDTPTPPQDVDSSDKNKFDEVSSNAQGISNHMTASRPKPQGRRPSSRSSSTTSLTPSIEPTNDDDDTQPTTTTTTESIPEPTPVVETEPTPPPQPVEMPVSTDQTTLIKWLKASASLNPADAPDEELDVGVVVSLLPSCIEELQEANVINVDGDEVMGGVGAITTSTITQPHFLKIVRDPEYRADLRDKKFKMAKAKKIAEEAQAKRLSDVASEEQVASDLERQAEEAERKLAEMEKRKKMPNWKRDQMNSSIEEEVPAESTNAEEPDWKLDLKVKKKRASMITSPISSTSAAQSSLSDAEAKLVLRMLIAINKGESTIPIKSEIPATVSKQTLLKTWEMATEVFILPQTSRLTRYLEQAQGLIALKAFETVVTPVIKSSTLVSDQAATKTEEAPRVKVFVARDEQERADREALEKKNAALLAAKEAKEAAKREEIEQQQQKEIEKQTQEEEEQLLLAAMPSWKRELYLRDKGSVSGHRKAKRQSVQMVSSVQTLLQKRLEKNAEEERIAEEKSSQVTDSMTVNRAWNLLSASRDVPRSTSTEKSRRQTLMEGLQQIGQAPKVLPLVEEGIPEEVDEDGNNAEQHNNDNEGDAAALEMEKKAKEIDEKIRMLQEKKKKEKSQETAAVKIQAGFRGSLGRKKAKQIKEQMEEHQKALAARQTELDSIMQQQAQLHNQTLILQKQHLLQKMQTQQELAQKKAEIQAQAQQGRGGKHSQTMRVAPRPRLSSDSSSATSSTVRGPRSSQAEHVANITRKSRTETLRLSMGTVNSLTALPSENEDALARQDAIQRIRMKSLQTVAAKSKSEARVLDGSGLYIVDGYYLDTSGTFAVSEKDHPQDLPQNFTANSPIKMMHKTKSFA